jgi:hypothetical protein
VQQPAVQQVSFTILELAALRPDGLQRYAEQQPPTGADERDNISGNIAGQRCFREYDGGALYNADETFTATTAAANGENSG